MEKIYDQAKDKNVAAVVIYLNGDELDACDSNPEGAKIYAYADKDCTIKMKISELKDAFVKRAIVNAKNAYYIPILYDALGEGYAIGIYNSSGILYGVQGIKD